MAKKTKKPEIIQPVPVQKSSIHKVGHLAFFIGLVLVVASAIVNYYLEQNNYYSMSFQATMIVLGLFGLIVGLLNITRTETTPFLVASTVIIIAFWLTMDPIRMIHVLMYNIWGNVIVFIATSALVVAFKTVYETASDY